MINFPESLPFLGLASNNCTYTTSHNRKKDLLQIFFHRPSFNNNFCFIYFPLWRTVRQAGFLDVHRSECMWFCFFASICLLLVPVISFSSLLYSLQWKCMCVCFVFAYTRRFAPFVLFDVVCAVRSIFFISQQSFRSLLLTFLSLHHPPLLVYILSDT